MSIHNVSKYELIDTSEFVMGVLLGGRCSSLNPWIVPPPTPNQLLTLAETECW